MSSKSKTPDSLYPLKRRTSTGSLSPLRSGAPPLAPIKSTSPRSRVFSRSQSPRSFELIYSGSSQPSPYFDPEKDATYLEQCFEVMGELGKGSYGVVYKVRSKQDSQLYAVKKTTRKFKSKSDRWRMLEEVRSGIGLGSHPFCMTYHDAWEENNFLYIQLEYCIHGSLNDYTLDNTLQEDDLWRILFNISLGLKHIHENGYVHLDIKPANIFMDASQCVKIGDFGIIQRIEKTGKGIHEEFEDGDPIYMAPELLHPASCSPAADVFSAGMTMLDLASGRELPGYGPGWHELRSGNIPRELFGTCSDDLVQLVESMVHEDPKMRPTVDEILAHRHIRPHWLRFKISYLFWAPLNSITTFVSSIFAQLRAKMTGSVSGTTSNVKKLTRKASQQMVPMRIDFSSDEDDPDTSLDTSNMDDSELLDPALKRTQIRLNFEDQGSAGHSSGLQRRLRDNSESPKRNKNLARIFEEMEN
eukprot:m.181286 g.181286  ORF g.181286 m.181286 type:complete len:472 (+) comp15514_c0_seq7:280-1695(+)